MLCSSRVTRDTSSQSLSAQEISLIEVPPLPPRPSSTNLLPSVVFAFVVPCTQSALPSRYVHRAEGHFDSIFYRQHLLLPLDHPSTQRRHYFPHVVARAAASVLSAAQSCSVKGCMCNCSIIQHVCGVNDCAKCALNHLRCSELVYRRPWASQSMKLPLSEFRREVSPHIIPHFASSRWWPMMPLRSRLR